MEPEPQNRFSGTETGTGAPLMLNCAETHKKSLPAEEPPEPKTGTARTVPPPNRK